MISVRVARQTLFWLLTYSGYMILITYVTYRSSRPVEMYYFGFLFLCLASLTFHWWICVAVTDILFIFYCTLLISSFPVLLTPSNFVYAILLEKFFVRVVLFSLPAFSIWTWSEIHLFFLLRNNKIMKWYIIMNMSLCQPLSAPSY